MFAWSRTALDHPAPQGVEPRNVDPTDADAVRRTLAEIRPTAVFHLAGSARTTYEPVEFGKVWRTHVDGTLNVARAGGNHLFRGAARPEIDATIARTFAFIDEQVRPRR